MSWAQQAVVTFSAAHIQSPALGDIEIVSLRWNWINWHVFFAIGNDEVKARHKSPRWCYIVISLDLSSLEWSTLIPYSRIAYNWSKAFAETDSRSLIPQPQPFSIILSTGMPHPFIHHHAQHPSAWKPHWQQASSAIPGDAGEMEQATRPHHHFQ